MIRIETHVLLQFLVLDVLLNYNITAASADNAQTFDDEEVTTALRRVKCNKSTGPDCILRKLLNVWVYALGQPLCGLVN